MPREKSAQRKSPSVQRPSPQCSQLSRDKLPAGLTLRHELYLPDETESPRALAWSPDGRILAVGTTKGHIWLWDSQIIEFISDRIQSEDIKYINAMAWSPNSTQLAFAGDPGNAVVIAEIADNRAKRLRTIRVAGENRLVYTIAWSLDAMALAVSKDSSSISIVSVTGSGDERILTSDGVIVPTLRWMRDGRLVSGSSNATLSVWDSQSGEVQKRFEGHTDVITSLALTPNETQILSAALDHSVQVWDLESGTQIAILEGHHDKPGCVDVSADAWFAASHGNTGEVRLWRLDTLACIADFVQPGGSLSTIRFHPTKPQLAVAGQDSETVSIYELNIDALLGQPPDEDTVRYANAKVVLVGDTGVGKTGLANRLVHRKFEPSESTHGRRVLTLGSETAREDATETHREILLWDLAGQPGYRLVHQLHMTDASIALILFDARSETDPFGAARYWSQALDQAQSNAPITKFLVAARIDRGGVGVGEARIRDFCKANGFDDRFFRTSAKTGEGCQELDEAIRAAIDWNQLPVVGSTQLLADVRGFIAAQKQDDSVPKLVTVGELWDGFRDTTERVLTEQDFVGCLNRLEKTDDLDILLFQALDASATDQDYVLLEPSYVDAYASAIVIAARDEPDGIGHLPEHTILDGRFRLNDEERLAPPESQNILLGFVIEELLSFEIALRELIDGVSYLVFPSQYTRDAPFPGSTSHGLRYDFAGPVRNIFATLLVRLAHNREFKQRDFYRDAARYESEQGGSCVIQFADTEEGRGRMTVFFEDDPPETIQRTFLEYVYQHLKRNALPQSIVRRRTYNCPECGYLFSDTVVETRLEAGRADISCPQCDTTSPLLDLTLRDDPTVADEVRHIDEDAQAALARQLADSAIQGKRRMGTYDLILIGHDHDLSPVLELAEILQSVGLRPWLETWEAGPDDPKANPPESILDRISVLVVAYGQSDPPWRDRRRSKQISDLVARELRPCLALLPGANLPSRRPAALKSADVFQLTPFTDTAESSKPLGDLVAFAIGRESDAMFSQRITTSLVAQRNKPVASSEAAPGTPIRVMAKQPPNALSAALVAQLAERLAAPSTALEGLVNTPDAEIMTIGFRNPQDALRLFAMTRQGDPYILDWFSRWQIEPSAFLKRHADVERDVRLRTTGKADLPQSAVEGTGGPAIVKSVTIENFRCFDSLTIELNQGSPLAGQWTCLAGINGAGKSSVLQAICLTLLGDRTALELGTAFLDHLRRLEDGQTRDARIGLTLGDHHQNDYVELELTDDGTSRRNGRPYDDRMKARWSELKSQVILAYGATRNLSSDPDLGQKRLGPEVRRQITLFDPLAKIASAETLTMRHASDSPFVTLFQRLVQLVFGDELEILHKDGELRFQLRSEQQSESAVEAVDLPDGFRSSAAWLADLCSVWCEKFPTQAQNGDPSDIRAIVMIDEIDLHLHPSLQRKLVPQLREALPHVQWIVTTHSPLVLSSFDMTELVLLDRNEPDGIRHLDRQILGFTSDQVYEWLMDTKPTSSELTQQLERVRQGDTSVNAAYVAQAMAVSPEVDQEAARQTVRERLRKARQLRQRKK